MLEVKKTLLYDIKTINFCYHKSMGEMSEQSTSAVSTSEQTSTFPDVPESTQPPMDQESAAPVEAASRLAEGIKEDTRMSGIRDELVLGWKQQNGSEWTTNSRGGLDLRPDFQDWMYGSNEQWAKGGKPPTLDSRTEEEFRKRFPEDAATYDQMESVRVYDRPDLDPVISRLQSEVIKQTNTDAEVKRALDTGRGRFGQSFREVWDSTNTRVTIMAYRRFITDYPEKAQAYAAYNPMIKRLLESQNRTYPPVNGTLSEPAEQLVSSNQDQLAGEPNQEPMSTTEREAQNLDPRDYFRGTTFQKDAEQIDPDKSHPWQAAWGDGFLVRDEFGQIALTETFDTDETDEDNKVGLLLAETARDGQSSSTYIRNELSTRVREQLAGVINEVSPRLSGETRHTFVRILIQLVPSLENQTDAEVAETLSTLTLKLLPDHPQGIEASEVPQIGTASLQQQEQLTRLMKLVSKKMPAEIFSQKLNELQDNLRWTDDAFGRNYASMLSEIKRWALDSRQDTVRNYDVLRKKEPVDYPVKDKVTRDFTSPEELERIVRGLPVELMPDVRFAPRNREQAELVQLDQVLGGTGIYNWTVSISQGRGVEKIFELSQALKEGSASVAGNNQPIKAIEVDGKFFIEADGRHRTAALKALGVKEVPMLVTHIKK